MNDESDFDSIFQRYYEPLYFFARHFVDDPEECRDLVMAVFEDLWRHVDKVESDAAKAWLFVNLRNKCLDHQRKLKRQRQYTAATILLDNKWIEDTDPVEQQERERTIQRRLDALPDNTRRIFEACYVDGKKYKEVAEELGISISTVKKHIVRALKIVKNDKTS
jgi:RNA polymerase sigma-70 factor (family 1)